MPGVIDVLSSVHSVFLPHCSDDDDNAWEPVYENELEHAEPVSTAVGANGTKSVVTSAEEQNAGRVVDYFYRMEFHSTPHFFPDSNYLFFSPAKLLNFRGVCIFHLIYPYFLLCTVHFWLRR